MKNLILLSVLILGTYSKIYSQKPGVVMSDKDGWHKIGEKIVDFKTDADEILVVGADKFAVIKIKVDKAPINLVSFDIYFENGEKQSVPIGEELKVPGETRVVKLSGGERSIKKVTFIYKTVTDDVKDKKAQVELWGMKTNTDKKSGK